MVGRTRTTLKRTASTSEKPAKEVVAAAPTRSRATKRAASPEQSRTPSPAPPAKRRRAGAQIENGVEPEKAPKAKTAAKPASKKAEKPAPKKVEKPVAKKEPAPKKTPRAVEKRPLLNTPPTPPEHTRPAPVLFVWGAGNFGQFGMGEDQLGELEKPTRNKLVEEKMDDGEFGGQGAGLEAVAAGGMYSLFIDEQGTVSQVRLLFDVVSDVIRRFGLAEPTTTPLSDAIPTMYRTPKKRANSLISILLLHHHSHYSL